MSIFELNPRFRDFEAKGGQYRISIYEASPKVRKYRLWKMILDDGDVQERETDDMLVERLKHITENSTNL